MAEEASGFGWPRFGTEAELKSLCLQASRRTEAQKQMCPPSRAQRESVVEETVQRYWAARTPCPLWLLGDTPDYRLFTHEFAKTLATLNMDAGSGVPYAGFQGKRFHEDWLSDPHSMMQVRELVWKRILRLLFKEWRDPVQAIQDGMCDPLRVFIKGEPHKIQKLVDGRYRLIMSVSLVDQLVARLLFQDQNILEHQVFEAIPSQPGIGFSTDEQVLRFQQRVAQLSNASSFEEFQADPLRHVVPTDCSGFDWSVQQWMLEDDMEVRCRLTTRCSALCRKLRFSWLNCIQQSVFCLSNGTLYAQTSPGVQKSGSYNTSSTNSRVRVMASIHAGASWCLANGDDAVESPDTKIETYKLLGFKCERANVFDFCSHLFKEPGVAIPANIGKMLYRLLNTHTPLAQTLMQQIQYWEAAFSVLQEMRHLPKETLEELFVALGCRER